MTLSFAILAALLTVSAIAAVSLRNLVHCALSLIVTFAAMAGLFIQLGAQFVGFAQVLVYVGAVAILIVFAILLTRSGDASDQPKRRGFWWVGIAIAFAVFGVLAKVILSSTVVRREIPGLPTATVRQIGDQLMTNFVLPMEVIALLLTAAMLGAVIIALHEKESR